MAPTGMKIIDLAAEIVDGGDLRGGTIMFLGSPPRRYQIEDGSRFWLFRVDDNDHAENGDEYFTALALITTKAQSLSQMRDVTKTGGLMTIAVDHIARDGVQSVNEEGGKLYLVYGTIKLIPGGLKANFLDPPHKGFGWDEQTKAMATFAFDADGAPVHVHHLCLDADGKPVSRDEKQRILGVHRNRTVKTSDEDRAYTIDGYRRMMALAKIGAP
jgi:hypothetical protein